MTDLVVDTADQGGAYPQPRTQPRAEFPRRATAEKATGHKWHKGVWRGFAAPEGLPKEIAMQYETAL